jgi:hypothetical protein
VTARTTQEEHRKGDKKWLKEIAERGGSKSCDVTRL